VPNPAPHIIDLVADFVRKRPDLAQMNFFDAMAVLRPLELEVATIVKGYGIQQYDDGYDDGRHDGEHDAER
jgi:hypothetical protein